MEEKMRKRQKLTLAFRNKIFRLYGFIPEARKFIREATGILIRDLDNINGGGLWHTEEQIVEFWGVQHQAAVHELSHVWWHWFRLDYPDLKKGLVRDVVRLSEMDKVSNPEYALAIEFARAYVYGVGEWWGQYCNADYQNNPDNLPSDIHNLTEDHFEYRINDWEIFAGFCSWTMGCYKSGPRQLPEFMWKYFEPLFTGEIKTIPYYMPGGHP